MKPFLDRAFPGDRRVWITAAVVLGVMFAGILAALLVPREYYTGTNSVRTRGPAAKLEHGQRLCAPRLDIPAGTGRLQVEINGPDRRPAMTARIRAGGQVTTSTVPARRAHGREKVEFAVRKRPSSPEAVPGSACFTVGRGNHILLGGMPGMTRGDVPLRLDRRELNARPALWYLPPSGEQKALLMLLPDIFERAARFRPGIVGAWTYYLLLLGVLPGLVYAAVRLLASTAAGRRGRVAPGLVIFLLAFTNAVAWGLITPAFNAPDESEHFAYAQYFAESGDAISRTAGGDQDPYSTAEIIAIDRIKLFSSTEREDGHPPWLGRDEQRWRADNATHPGQGDGGGFTVTGSSQAPPYYALLAPAYWATHSQSIFTQLTAMRLMSALMGAIVALCAFLLVRELVPSSPLAAVGAGAIVAFQPMFGFMSGAVNNDMGVNAGAALILYLLVRSMRRGLTPWLGVALGVALAVTPVLKGTGYALYPAALLALAVMVYRQRLTRGFVPFIALAATFAVLVLGWHFLSPAFERPTLATPGGDVPVVGTVTNSPGDFVAVLSYVWQTFLPRLPFMSDYTPLFQWPAFETYVIRGWGAFGWYAMTFPQWVYVVIAVLMIGVGVLAAAALWRRRGGHRMAEVTVLVAAIAAVILGAEIAYFAPMARAELPVFGRYAFPAIAALAAVAVASSFAFPRRLRAPALTALVCLVLGLGYASQWLSLTSFYS